MRCLSVAALIMPGLAHADVFTLASQVTAAEIYPQGATLTRQVPFTIPAGSHQVQLVDLPLGTPLETLRVSVSGATLGTVTTRREAVPPSTPPLAPLLEQARTDVDNARRAIAAHDDQIATLQARVEAAQAQVAYLRSVTGAQPSSTPLQIAEITRMVGTEMLAAREKAIAAAALVRDADQAREALEDDLTAAEAALAALTPDDHSPRAFLGVTLSADAPVEGQLTVTYTIANAGWQPGYDIALSRADGLIAIDRSALVTQTTGENWHAVRLTLATQRPDAGLAASPLWPRLLTIEAPAEPPVAYEMMGRAAMADAAPPKAQVAAPQTVLDGISVSYGYPDPVDLASGVDATRLHFDSLSYPAQIYARAVPSRDRSAYVEARFTNASPEPLLSAAQVRVSLDGQYVGRHNLAQIAAGETVTLPFGAIPGLRLSTLRSDLETGDHGVITRVNAQSESHLYELRNLSGTDWDVRMLAQVPYSQHEDLEISWSADPMPDAIDLDGQHGIMEWHLALPAGAARNVSLSHDLRWPEDMVLR